MRNEAGERRAKVHVQLVARGVWRVCGLGGGQLVLYNRAGISMRRDLDARRVHGVGNVEVAVMRWRRRCAGQRASRCVY